MFEAAVVEQPKQKRSFIIMKMIRFAGFVIRSMTRFSSYDDHSHQVVVPTHSNGRVEEECWTKVNSIRMAM